MQEQTPDTILEQQPAAAEPEAAAQQPAADTQQPAEAAAPAKEEAPAQPAEPAAVTVVRRSSHSTTGTPQAVASRAAKRRLFTQREPSVPSMLRGRPHTTPSAPWASRAAAAASATLFRLFSSICGVTGVTISSEASHTASPVRRSP